MRKNLAIVALFVFLCVSLFLNLAAWGERIRLNGTIDEMTKGAEFDFKYINAQAETERALANYCNNQKEINVATLKNENMRLMEAVARLPELVLEVDNTASKTAQIRQERSDFIKTLKYATTVVYDQ